MSGGGGSKQRQQALGGAESGRAVGTARRKDMCRAVQGRSRPGRGSFQRLNKDRCRRSSVFHAPRHLAQDAFSPSEPHPVDAGGHRRAGGAVRLGKGRQGGREGDSAGCWGPRLGPLGVWCLALLLCRDLVMRCDAMRCELVPARNAGSQEFPS